MITEIWHIRIRLLALSFLVFSFGVLSSQLQWWPATIFAHAQDAYRAYNEREQRVAGTRPKDTNGRNGENIGNSGKIRSNEPDATYAGFTFICKDDYSPVLVDMQGKRAHQWQVPFSAAFPPPSHIKNPVPDHATYCVSAHLYPNGDVIEVLQAAGDTPYGYGLIKMDKDSKVLWTLAAGVHHDVHVASDGRIYTLIQDYIHEPIPQLDFYTYPILPDWVVIMTPEGEMQKKISVLHAFLGTPFEPILKVIYDRRFKNYENKFDVTHANSVMPLEPAIAGKFKGYKPGFLLVSLKNMDALVVIDPETEKVVSMLRGEWKNQHQARFLENGNILLFDNDGAPTTDKTKFSRVLEIKPDTQEIVWAYEGHPKNRYYTKDKGGASLLPNGNTLTFSTNQGRVIESNREGKEVWHYKLSIPIPQAERFPSSYFTPEFCEKFNCKDSGIARVKAER